VLLTGLIGVVDAFTAVDVTVAVRDRVTDALNAVLTDKANGVVSSVRSFLTGGRSVLLTTAAAGALVTVSGAWAAVVGALNQAYDVAEERSWFARRLLGLVLGVATILVMVVTAALVLVGPLLGRGREIADELGLGHSFTVAWTWLRWPLVVVLLVAWLLAVFRYGPNRRTRWRAGLPGALVTTGGWLLVTAGFHLYVRLTAGSSVVLSAFGGGAVLMVWAYLLCFTLLVGGELNAVLAKRRATGGAGSQTVRGRWPDES